MPDSTGVTSDKQLRIGYRRTVGCLDCSMIISRLFQLLLSPARGASSICFIQFSPKFLHERSKSDQHKNRAKNKLLLLENV